MGITKTKKILLYAGTTEPITDAYVAIIKPSKRVAAERSKAVANGYPMEILWLVTISILFKVWYFFLSCQHNTKINLILTETDFINQNKEKWIELEQLLLSDQKDANQLNELFIKVSSDLAYAGTYFPNRSVRLYLNNLTKEVFNILPKETSKSGLQTLMEFFAVILPSEIYKSRRAFIVSFLVFAISVVIGVFSSMQNPQFAASILGKDYIEMTNENIANDDPMAVYKEHRQVDMFFGITLNNIRVAFLAFVLGLLGSFGTILVLMTNGIMVGAFQYYFYTKGLFLTSFLTIWIHGTIEISAIIIAGAAGIILGNGLLFPKSYSRSNSLGIYARRALRIILGTIPLFILAGFLESFVTRYTGLPTVVKVSIIFFSSLLILYMFVYLPYRVSQKKISNTNITINSNSAEERKINTNQKQSFTDILIASISKYRNFISNNWPRLCTILFVSFLFIFLYGHIAPIEEFMFRDEQINLFRDLNGSPLMPIFIFIQFSFWLSFIRTFSSSNDVNNHQYLSSYKNGFIRVISWSTILPLLSYFFIPGFLGVLTSIVIFLLLTIPSLLTTKDEGSVFSDRPLSNISLVFSHLFSFLPYFFILFGIYLSLLLLVNSPLSDLIGKYIYWHQISEDLIYSKIIIDHCLQFSILITLLPFIYFLFSNAYRSIISDNVGHDIFLRLAQFGENE